MKTTSTRISCRAMVFLSGLMLSGYALATDMSQAKSAGWVCEQDNGYARVAKPNAPADVRALVSSVNTKRKAEYQRIAQRYNRFNTLTHRYCN